MIADWRTVASNPRLRAALEFIESSRLRQGGAARFALAEFAQVVPGIDTAGVAVIPGNVQRIFTHRLHFLGPGRLLVHWQQAGGLLRGLARIAMVRVALFSAGSAGTGVPQPLEGEVGAMAVVPLNVHSGAGGDVDFDGFGVNHGHMDSIYMGLYSDPGKQIRLDI